jgi:hypothetical protein
MLATLIKMDETDCRQGDIENESERKREEERERERGRERNILQFSGYFANSGLLFSYRSTRIKPIIRVTSSNQRF